MIETKDLVLITNNDRVLTEYKDKYQVEYHDIEYVEVLKRVRDKVHQNYKILTHPMAGSLKPNQTPYKSVLVMPAASMDYKSLMLIENAIESANKFLKFRKLPNWNNRCIYDFKTLDLSFIEGAVNNKSLNPCY